MLSTSAPLQTAQIWAEVLKEVQQRIPQESFNTWFAHTTLEIFSEEGITSFAPIEELSERFRTITSLKSHIKEAVNNAQEQLLY